MAEEIGRAGHWQGGAVFPAIVCFQSRDFVSEKKITVRHVGVPFFSGSLAVLMKDYCV